MKTTTTKSSFGRFANDVEDNEGELTLPVGERHEIHPASGSDRWAVVNHETGHVVSEHDDIDDAVARAEAEEIGD